MTPSELIFVVDDSADYRLLLQQVFKRFFTTYSVRLFAGGHLLLNEPPQLHSEPRLILLDRHMPDLDGYQTLLRLKQHPAYQRIPVVMMSADATLTEVEACSKAGSNSFLQKPIDLNLLKQTISTICQYWLDLKQSSAPKLDKSESGGYLPDPNPYPKGWDQANTRHYYSVSF
jgi:CheY-like chemotaxis protein